MKYIASILLLVCATATAEIYKWVDKNGKTHFSDKKPAHLEAEEVKLRVNSFKHVSYEVLGPEEEKPAKTRDEVVMYSTEWCGYCKKARNYFQKNNIPFKEYDIEKSSKAKKEYDSLGGRGVPLIKYGKKLMNGFSIEGFEKFYNNEAKKNSRIIR
ncbi:glutaredoxin domain-containing protein [Maricurvus nonylphenolicus]|uniref:glutaredoxin domain-containing protein n=1 Tax=Maricurvus nonylphenolicus TaxID=1008307 RepID=UPI0036F3557F